MTQDTTPEVGTVTINTWDRMSVPVKLISRRVFEVDGKRWTMHKRTEVEDAERYTVKDAGGEYGCEVTVFTDHRPRPGSSSTASHCGVVRDHPDARVAAAQAIAAT